GCDRRGRGAPPHRPHGGSGGGPRVRLPAAGGTRPRRLLGRRATGAGRRVPALRTAPSRLRPGLPLRPDPPRAGRGHHPPAVLALALGFAGVRWGPNALDLNEAWDEVWPAAPVGRPGRGPRPLRPARRAARGSPVRARPRPGRRPPPAPAR